MAPPSDRDKDSNPSQPKSENPFVKFRQFADSQIGSLLQGIIGLPSTFSRNQSENPRWADFDEDLRRRDELQARQRDLRESEARRLRQTTEESQVPVRQCGPFTQRNEHNQSPSENEDCGLRDLPLYSAVSKSLFSHLPEANDGERDWKKTTFDFPSVGFFHGHFPLQQNYRSPGSLSGTQYMIYNALASSSRFRSDYSLLPYLMFSPYSPIRLSTSSSQNSPSTRGILGMPRDDFPYCEAFQDLIQSTQPHQEESLFSQAFKAFSRNPGIPRMFGIADIGVEHLLWIEHLYFSNILQQKEVREMKHTTDGLPDIFHFAGLDVPKKQSVERGNSSEDAQTEQDMYDRFLRWASIPSTVGSALELVFKEPSNPEESDETASSNAEAWEERHATAFRNIAKTLERLESSSKAEPSQEPFQNGRVAKSTQDPDRVVSTSTTTDQVTHEDGSIETCVTVWKRFANGRETTTTTSHSEAPAWDADEEAKELPESVESQSNKTPDKKIQKKKENKGWFWN